MHISEITFKAKDFLDYELQDGYGDEGGIPHEHYTLEEYLGEISEDENDYKELLELDMYELNKILVTESYIAPISYNFEKERKDFACMIAYYYAQEQHIFDSFTKMSEFVEYADSYDFKIDEWEFNNTGKYVLNAEDARLAAQSFAKEIAANNAFSESDMKIIKSHMVIQDNWKSVEKEMDKQGQNWHSGGDMAESVFSFGELSVETKEKIRQNYVDWANRSKTQFVFTKNTNLPNTITDDCIIQIGWDPEWGERAALFLNEEAVTQFDSFYDYIIEDRKISALWSEIK